MGAGKATGQDREYQVLARDILKRRSPIPLEPYSGDGVDVAIKLGSATRTFDVALKDSNNRLVVAECKRTKSRVKLADLEVFAYRVELLRKETGAEAAGVFFAKTAYQLGPVKAAPDAHIEVAICSQDQPKNAFGLMFERYDPEREWRIRDGEAFINCGHRMNMRQGIRMEGSTQSR